MICTIFFVDLKWKYSLELNLVHIKLRVEKFKGVKNENDITYESSKAEINKILRITRAETSQNDSYKEIV